MSRDAEMKRYQISKWRYRELKAVVMQYDERRRRISEMITLPGGISAATGGGGVSDTTQRTVLRMERLQSINDAIDRAAGQVPQGTIIRRAAGYADAVERLRYIGSKSDFYRNRRKFYWLLDQEI